MAPVSAARATALAVLIVASALGCETDAGPTEPPVEHADRTATSGLVLTPEAQILLGGAVSDANTRLVTALHERGEAEELASALRRLASALEEYDPEAPNIQLESARKALALYEHVATDGEAADVAAIRLVLDRAVALRQLPGKQRAR